jgi:hypothetical protein
MPLILVPLAFPQIPQSDPHAVLLAQQSITALTNGIGVTDVTLNASTTWIAGSDVETGSATFQAKGTGESLVQLSLTNGTRGYMRNNIASIFPQGATIVDGSVQTWPMHNCWTDVSWFFPALSFLAATSDPSLIFSYVGRESRGTSTVEHIRAYRFLAAGSPAFVLLTETVSTTDYYLDSTSGLPVAFVFNTHPDDDASTNISLEIDFSNYQSLNGVRIPFRVQKLISGGLALDVAVTGVTLNSGLPDSLFSIPQQ